MLAVVQPRNARSRRTRQALVNAVREELRQSSAFTVERVVERADCSAATYFSHFASKDDALTETYVTVCADLEKLTVDLFDVESLRTRGLPMFARHVETELVSFFRLEHRVFRAALARLTEHRDLARHHRAAQDATFAHVARFFSNAAEAGLIACVEPAVRAAAVVVLAEGFDNPRLLRARGDDPIHAVLASALAAIIAS